jgi:hypothetical protein
MEGRVHRDMQSSRIATVKFSYATESECGFMERTNLDQSDFFENKIVDLGLRVTRARRREGVLHGGWQD